MAIDYDKLMNWKFDPVESEYTSKDSILYALGVGLSADPLDMDQLRFTYEEDQLALPTMAVVLAYPGFFLKDPQFGVDWVKVLHGEQGIEIHKQLPAAAKVVGENRFTEIIDKGEGQCSKVANPGFFNCDKIAYGTFYTKSGSDRPLWCKV